MMGSLSLIIRIRTGKGIAISQRRKKIHEIYAGTSRDGTSIDQHFCDNGEFIRFHLHRNTGITGSL